MAAVRAVFLLLLVASAFYVLLSRKPVARENGGPRGVLLVTIDTLRADAVGPGKGTPAFEAFLRTATWYRNTRSPAPLTLPAHLTMLSGLDPIDHGIHDNAAPRIPKDRGYPLLAEDFRANLYATAAFLSCAVLGKDTGIDSGFDTFDCPSFGARWSGDPGDLSADERVKAPLAWLGSLAQDQPFFLWVHFFDPHDPYLPFAGDARRPGTREGDGDAALYAGEVRRVDAALELLLRAVSDETTVVVASDHGESLGEHGEPTHGNLCYGATMDVLLAVRKPKHGRGRVDDSLHSLKDIAPSVRWWSFVTAEEPWFGGSLDREGKGVTVGSSLLAYRTHGWAQVLCAYDGRYSLVESGPRVELFDRATDPGESRPLAIEGHEAYERLDRELTLYRARGARASPEIVPDSASPYGAARRPLSAMLDRPANAALRDPATGFAFSEAILSARGLLHVGVARRSADALRAAVTRLETLGTEDATSPLPWELLAHARGALAQVTGDLSLHASAAAAAREAMDRGYLVAPLLYLLLAQAVASGDGAVQRAALDDALARRIAPDLPCAEQAAELARQLGAFDEGRDFLARVRTTLTDPRDLARLDRIEAAMR